MSPASVSLEADFVSQGTFLHVWGHLTAFGEGVCLTGTWRAETRYTPKAPTVDRAALHAEKHLVQNVGAAKIGKPNWERERVNKNRGNSGHKSKRNPLRNP